MDKGVDKVATSQLHSPQFDLRLGILSMWSFIGSSCVYVGFLKVL